MPSGRMRIELVSTEPQSVVLPLNYRPHGKCVNGLEPSPTAWKAVMLPITPYTQNGKGCTPYFRVSYNGLVTDAH